MTDNPLIFIDTETTGLDPNQYEAYEVAWAGEEGHPQRLVLPHDWRNGDPVALSIGRYFEREVYAETAANEDGIDLLHKVLTGATLVGSNPGFDAAHLTNLFRRFERYDPSPWHHRLVNVAEGAMWLFGWDRPKGLADVRKELIERGAYLPRPDHTAVGDVLATRAVYVALRRMRAAKEEAA